MYSFTRRVLRGLIIGVAAAGAGCGGGSTPTAPAIPQASSVPVSPASGVTTATWACMTASRAGVFGAAGQGCSIAAPASQSLRADAPIVAPGGVTNLSSSVSGTTVTLTWQASGSGDPATSYVIDAGSSSGLSDIVSFDTGSTATSFAATAVPAGRYFVRVRARNAAGSGLASNEVIVIVGAAPCATAPGPPTGLAGNVAGATVTLTWTAPAGTCPTTSYIIEAGASTGLANLASLSTGTPATTFTTASVPNGTYFVRVRAGNAGGASAPSNEIVLTVGTTAPPVSFTDSFETDTGWAIAEEIVNGNPCYIKGAGEVARSTDVSLDGAYSLRVWSNKALSMNSNKVIGYRRISTSAPNGTWFYSVHVYIAPETANSGQVGPEFGIQNTRPIAPGQFRTATADIQYRAVPAPNPVAATWAAWAEVAPGVGDYMVFQTAPLAAGNWYALDLEVDYTRNRYVRFAVQGPGVHFDVDLSAFAIAQEVKFNERVLVVTLEAGNRFTNCGAMTNYKVYYDDVVLRNGSSSLGQPIQLFRR